MLKLRDVKRIAEYYLESLPGWRMIGKNRLVRENGPVMQGILFEQISFENAARPESFIRVLVVPDDEDAMELCRGLDHPNGAPGRTIHIRDYERQRDEIIREFHRQFRPAVGRPLDPLKTLKMYEHDAIPLWYQARSIAALHAYFGHDRRARRWCRRFRRLLAKERAHLGDLEHLNARYIEALEEWLKAGEARVQLDGILTEERKKIGLAE